MVQRYNLNGLRSEEHIEPGWSFFRGPYALRCKLSQLAKGGDA